MNTQRRGPLFKHQAQGTAWAAGEPLPRRGTLRLTLLIVALWCAGTLAVVAVGV